MDHASAQGVDERMINVHYYYYSPFATPLNSFCAVPVRQPAPRTLCVLRSPRHSTVSVLSLFANRMTPENVGKSAKRERDVTTVVWLAKRERKVTTLMWLAKRERSVTTVVFWPNGNRTLQQLCAYPNGSCRPDESGETTGPR